MEDVKTRQSSGLVKKGKFVRALMDYLNTEGPMTAKGLFNTGQCGPSTDYVQANLDKLVGSKEVVIDGDRYKLTGVPKPSPREHLMGSDPKPDEVVAGYRPLSLVDSITPTNRHAEVPTTTIYKLELVGNKLPRNEALEYIMVWAWLNDYPWEEATEQYCATHAAKWKIAEAVKKSWGERLEFSDEVPE